MTTQTLMTLALVLLSVLFFAGLALEYQDEIADELDRLRRWWRRR